MRHSSVRCLALLLSLALAGLTRAADTEHWYRVLMSGAPAGWSRESETTADGRITSLGEMNFRIKRGSVDIAISMRSEFVETTDGKPVSMTLHQELGSVPIDSRYVFSDSGIDVETTQAGQTTKSKRPLPTGPWLTPAAAGRQTRDRIAKGDKEFTLSTIDIMGGAEVTKVKHRVIGPETVVIGDKPQTATKVLTETSQMAGMVATEYIDAEGATLKSDTAFGAFQMTLVRSGPEAKEATTSAPELMISTFVTPDRPIENCRTLKGATYLLSIGPGGSMPDIPQTGAQTPERTDAAHVRLHIQTSPLNPAPDAESTDAQLLASTTTANYQDPEVKKLAPRALKDAPESKSERAEALRRFVYKFIKKKSLDVGFGTASEVARTKAGDCSEHGVLLATLLRADGIPSRVAAGLIYVDAFEGERGVFGYHMWAQALLDIDGAKRWVDLDGTLPASTPFDAAHIALGVSDLSDDGSMASMAALVSVLGRLEIKVEEFH